jgi:hypothetical protein
MEGGISGSGVALYSFTPVRRRQSSVNIRRFHGDPEKEWTAARCHRLLRALTSRVAILKKEISHCSSTVNGQTVDSAVEVTVRPIRRVEKVQTFDDDWTRARKRIRRTYSGRGAKGATVGRSRTLSSVKERTALAPGEVSVPTPVLARAWGDRILEHCTASTPAALKFDVQHGKWNKRQKTQDTTNDREQNFQLSETLREMRPRLHATQYSIYEGIYNGLDTLLKATASNASEMKPHNARSLMSMCLRAVPRYIEEEELQLAAHLEDTGRKSAIDPRDVSTEVYDDLESFGSCGHGWKKLSIVVRSHGIQVLSHALQAGLLDTEFCGALITLCVQNSAENEAEILLSALLSLHIPDPNNVHSRFNDNPTTRPLSMLWNFVEYSGRYSYQYRQLSAMISNGILSVGWLATKEFSAVWTGIFQTLSLDSDNADALLFLHTSLPRLGGMCYESIDTAPAESELIFALKNTFSSLLTTLSSIVILSKETCIQSGKSELSIVRYGHIINLLRICLVQDEIHQSFTIGGSLLRAANLIVGSDNDCADSNLALAVSLLDQLREGNNTANGVSAPYNDLVVFVCCVARCCGRGASSSGFEHLKKLHCLLGSLGVNTLGGDILHEVVVDSAIAFAQQVPDWKHVEYASCIDSKIHTRNTRARPSPVSGNIYDDSRTGFRWEEGIGEWVTATPAVDNKCKNFGLLAPTDESECDTPFRPPPALRRKVDKITPIKIETHVLRSRHDLHSGGTPELLVDSPGGEASLMDELFDYGDEDHSSHREDSNIDEEDSFSNTSLIQCRDSDPDISTSLASDVSSAPFESGDSTVFRRSITRAPRLSRKVVGKGQDWPLFDESFASDSEVSRESNSASNRQFIHRVPRLGGRALRSSQAWRVFDESDDELSSLSFHSVLCEEHRVLQEVTNNAGRNYYPLRQTKFSSKQTKSAVSPSTESEDELCL